MKTETVRNSYVTKSIGLFDNCSLPVHGKGVYFLNRLYQRQIFCLITSHVIVTAVQSAKRILVWHNLYFILRVDLWWHYVSRK